MFICYLCNKKSTEATGVCNLPQALSNSQSLPRKKPAFAGFLKREYGGFVFTN